MRSPAATAALLLGLTGCAQCPDPFAPPAAPPLSLVFPTGIAVHPREPILFVASSNTDRKYDTGAVLALRLDWLVADINLRGFIEEPIADPWQGSVLVASNGQELVVTPDGKHLLHTTRGRPHLIALDVDVGPDDVQLSCGTGVDRTNPNRAIPTCDSGSRVYQPRFQDPSGIAVVPGAGQKWRVYLGFLRNGFLQALDLDPANDGAGRISMQWEKDLGGNVRGGMLEVQPSINGQPPFLWATARTAEPGNLQDGSAYLLDLWRAPNAEAGRLDLFDGAGSLEARGVAFSSDGSTAYVVSKLPPALVQLDITRLPGGTPRLDVKRVLPLGREASNVALYEPPEGPPLLLTTSFRDNLIMAVDAETMTLTGTIRDACASPWGMAVDHGRNLAFVSCYNDDVVAVVALPRTAGERRFHVAARLGTPRNQANANPDLDQYIPPIPVPGL